MQKPLQSSDQIGIVREQWTHVRPDIDTLPMETIGRILRVQHLFEIRMRRMLSKYGIDPGGFDVLATLRRSGQPYQMTPTRLYQELVLTSGAMTHRMDALENMGLLERVRDPNDRRSTMAHLTEQGKQLVDLAMEEHLTAEAETVAHLTERERTLLAELLKKLLLQMEIKQ